MSLNPHLVRFGVLGHLGRFHSPEGHLYPRGTRLVCRTPRGLEIGEVLLPIAEDVQDTDGTVLRAVTIQDELLISRLERNKQQAFTACENQLAQRGSAAVLMDAELLFDGQSLFFYFLGPTDPTLERLTAELAETYEAQVQFRKFTQTLLDGCGPDCGTGEPGEGCGSGGGCSSCAVAQACGTRRTGS